MVDQVTAAARRPPLQAAQLIDQLLEVQQLRLTCRSAKLATTLTAARISRGSRASEALPSHRLSTLDEEFTAAELRFDA